MLIETYRIAKEIFRNKKLTIRKLKRNKCEINYRNESNEWRGNHNRKAFLFPAEILIDKTFVEGMALYLGDGDYYRKDRCHLAFASKDFELIESFLSFLRKYFNLQNKDLTVMIIHRRKDSSLGKRWSKILKFDKDRILTKRSDRHRLETCTIQVNGVIFRAIFIAVLNKLLASNFLRIKTLRRAFLRGLFAAEGNVGIDYKEKKPYISQITFSLSDKEVSLMKMTRLALTLEGINSRIVHREKTHSLELCITNWRNYLIFWNIALFSLCPRKNRQVAEIAQKVDIYLRLDNPFLKNFFRSLNLYQWQIAKIIDSWQANVCRSVSGFHLLRVEQILKLIEHSPYGITRVKKHTIDIRIGTLTNLKPSSIVWNFLKTFKSF